MIPRLQTKIWCGRKPLVGGYSQNLVRLAGSRLLVSFLMKERFFKRRQGSSVPGTPREFCSGKTQPRICARICGAGWPEEGALGPGRFLGPCFTLQRGYLDT